ncbi:uncharacterized protein LOC115890404 [Sitophilus oryzae]|uniref:Uncharacterized protein LOC115890404 n=1 Tax=Sitophilus oryzae TaxID=7048 RepID=A0A6J2YQZ6_SITOR|nr:uncharacterized protein LOC115890404 [Sitophilus oryzae]
MLDRNQRFEKLDIDRNQRYGTICLSIFLIYGFCLYLLFFSFCFYLCVLPVFTNKRGKRKGKEKKNNDWINLCCWHLQKDPKIRKQWVEKCYRKDTFSVKYKRICSKHFKLEDFEDLIKAKLLNFRPVRLKKDAIPSLLLGQFNNDEEKTSARSERALIKERKALVKSILENSTKPKAQAETNPECLILERKALVKSILENSTKPKAQAETNPECLILERKAWVRSHLENLAKSTNQTVGNKKTGCLISERKALVKSILENSTKPKAQAETNPECLILERKAWVRSHLENLAKFTNQTVENKKTGCPIIERNALVRSHLENSVKFSEQAVENSSPECPVSIKSEIDYAENETSEEFTVPPEPERLVGDNKPFIEYPITIKPEIILETSESTDLMVQALQEENQLLKCQVTDLQRKCADLESRVAHTEKQLEEVNSSFNERAKQLYKEVLLANEIDMIVVS